MQPQERYDTTWPQAVKIAAGLLNVYDEGKSTYLILYLAWVVKPLLTQWDLGDLPLQRLLNVLDYVFGLICNAGRLSITRWEEGGVKRWRRSGSESRWLRYLIGGACLGIGTCLAGLSRRAHHPVFLHFHLHQLHLSIYPISMPRIQRFKPDTRMNRAGRRYHGSIHFLPPEGGHSLLSMFLHCVHHDA